MLDASWNVQKHALQSFSFLFKKKGPFGIILYKKILIMFQANHRLLPLG